LICAPEPITFSARTFEITGPTANAGRKNDPRKIPDIAAVNIFFMDHIGKTKECQPPPSPAGTTFYDLLYSNIIPQRRVVDDVRTCFENATTRFFIPSLSLNYAKIN
jgi:hypothetical protein